MAIEHVLELRQSIGVEPHTKYELRKRGRYLYLAGRHSEGPTFVSSIVFDSYRLADTHALSVVDVLARAFARFLSPQMLLVGASRASSCSALGFVCKRAVAEAGEIAGAPWGAVCAECHRRCPRSSFPTEMTHDLLAPCFFSIVFAPLPGCLLVLLLRALLLLLLHLSCVSPRLLSFVFAGAEERVDPSLAITTTIQQPTAAAPKPHFYFASTAGDVVVREHRAVLKRLRARFF